MSMQSLPPRKETPNRPRSWRHPSSQSGRVRVAPQARQSDCRPGAASSQCTVCEVVCADARHAVGHVTPDEPPVAASYKRVAPAKAMLLPQMLVEMLHVPAMVTRLVLAQQPRHLVGRHPSGRGLPQPFIKKPLKPFLLVAPAITSELPFRAAQDLAGLLCGKLSRLPPAQHITKLLHPAVL